MPGYACVLSDVKQSPSLALPVGAARASLPQGVLARGGNRMEERTLVRMASKQLTASTTTATTTTATTTPHDK